MKSVWTSHQASGVMHLVKTSCQSGFRYSCLLRPPGNAKLYGRLVAPAAPPYELVPAVPPTVCHSSTYPQLTGACWLLLRGVNGRSYYAKSVIETRSNDCLSQAATDCRRRQISTTVGCEQQSCTNTRNCVFVEDIQKLSVRQRRRTI